MLTYFVDFFKKNIDENLEKWAKKGG